MSRLNWLPLLLAFGLIACEATDSSDRLPGADTDEEEEELTEAQKRAALGDWSELLEWPIVPIHSVLLPDGRVLTYGSTVETGGGPEVISGGLSYDIWDPTDPDPDDGHMVLPNFTGTDIFCSAQVVLPQPDAGVLIAGGDTFPRREPTPDPDADPDAAGEVPEDDDDGNQDSTVLDYAGNQELTRGSTMNRGRWYGTATTLVDGTVYVQGGRSFSLVSGADLPEIRGLDGIFRLLTGADTSALRYYYPRNFVMPDGTLFGFDTRGTMYRVDTSGTGSVTTLSRFGAAYRGDDSTAAMFRPGRILQFGGTTVEDSVEPRSLIIDANMPTPKLTRSGDLSSLRRLATATILPDGTVLATGGSTVYNKVIGVNNKAEIWDPITGEWTLGAEPENLIDPRENHRLYHSTALLLPDGSVLVGGGGLPGPFAHEDAEIYYPPYLFNAAGKRAARPRISAPDTLSVGRNFRLGSSDAVRVTLVKTGSMTHNWNMDQRFIELPFTRVSPSALDVRMPSNIGEVPPGYYMLFAHNAAGVPSLGKIVFINVAPTPDPAQDPVIVPLDYRSNAQGVAQNVLVEASDPAGDALNFAAAGLPPGVSLTPVSATRARLSGTPSEAGSYDVVVTASDGERTSSSNFVWTIRPAATP